MPKFKKKPVVIEARQWTGDNFDELREWVGKNEKNGRWRLTLDVGNRQQQVVVVATLEGLMTGDIGDWIIKGVKGEFYPCKPDIFEQSYELVVEPDVTTLADVHETVRAEVRNASKTAGQWTLGELIDALEKQNPDHTVYFDFGHFVPGRIDSYRGYYDQLALEYRNASGADYPTVTKLLAVLKEAIGKTYTGYRGGEFTMSRDTMLWVANSGEAGGTAVVGLYDDVTWCTMIRTAHID